MGTKKYLEEVKEYLHNSPVVESTSLYRLIRARKQLKQYHKQLIRNLIKKRQLKPLTRGCYTIHDEVSLAVFCFTPAYLGLEDALSYHGLWEQETIPIVVTTRKVRQGLRKFAGTNYLVRRIDRKYYFGVDYYPVGEFSLPYSDKEKTFLDVLYFKLKFTDEELQEMATGLDTQKLWQYLERYPEKMRKRVKKILAQGKERQLCGLPALRSEAKTALA